jgi:ribonuclease HII
LAQDPGKGMPGYEFRLLRLPDARLCIIISGELVTSSARYPHYEFDRHYAQNGAVVVGLDEAGRGPLAGPVVSAACILDLDNPIEGIDDSKKLKPQKRELLYDRITAGAIKWAVAIIDVATIDRINILNAALFGMYKASKELNEENAIYLVDGNRPVHGLQPQVQIVKGDTKSASIAAASIIAKVTRDRYMLKLADEFPEFGFSSHFGYPTKKHFEALNEFGATKYHRRSFAPVKKALENGREYGRIV